VAERVAAKLLFDSVAWPEFDEDNPDPLTGRPRRWTTSLDGRGQIAQLPEAEFKRLEELGAVVRATKEDIEAAEAEAKRQAALNANAEAAAAASVQPFVQGTASPANTQTALAMQAAGPPGGGSQADTDLQSMNVQTLRQTAEARGLTVPSKAKKEQIIALLEAQVPGVQQQSSGNAQVDELLALDRSDLLRLASQAGVEPETLDKGMSAGEIADAVLAAGLTAADAGEAGSGTGSTATNEQDAKAKQAAGSSEPSAAKRRGVRTRGSSRRSE